MIKRLRACSDACKAIDFLHQHKYIHRDLKAENYFVGRKNIIKLGDFGESTRFRSRESSSQKRMSILGTVAFMAPELIQANKFYTESIDIYALSITMWEIMTGHDPYADYSQFQIYDKVMEGNRPILPTIGPSGFDELLQDGWHHDYLKRPNAKELCSRLQIIISNLMNPNRNNSNNSEGVDNNDNNNDYDVCDVSFSKSIVGNDSIISNIDIDINYDNDNINSSNSSSDIINQVSSNNSNTNTSRQSSRPTIVTLSRDGIKTFNPLFLRSSTDSNVNLNDDNDNNDDNNR